MRRRRGALSAQTGSSRTARTTSRTSNGFTKVRANTDRSTEGCILVGRGRAVDTITDSRAALTTLIETIEAGIAAGGCEIEIVDTGGLTV